MGIVLFVKAKDEIALEEMVTMEFIFLKKDISSITPQELHHGSLMIENLKIDAGLTLATLRSSLSMYEVRNAYQPHNYRLFYKGINIFFEFNEEETNLMDVSIGPDNKAK